ncbi:MAG: DUF3108 domain-containing protein [Gammaproteobacteria bacterium]|nr:DUF3108 domain-containing protein [Gammaproteobacteria bacterium]
MRLYKMKHLKPKTYGLALLLALWMPVVLAQPTPPTPFKARYELGNDLIIAAETELSLIPLAEQRWRYRSHTKAVGLAAMLNIKPINERSELEWHNGQLRSLHYQSDQKGQQAESHFDWQHHTLTVSSKGTQHTSTLTEGTLDHASALLHLMQRPQPWQRFSLQVNEKGTPRLLTFINQGHETIQTPHGSYDSIKVRQTRDPGKEIGMIWLAPKLHNLPIRIEQHKNNKLVARMELTAVTFLSTTDKRAP